VDSGAIHEQTDLTAGPSLMYWHRPLSGFQYEIKTQRPHGGLRRNTWANRPQSGNQPNVRTHRPLSGLQYEIKTQRPHGGLRCNTWANRPHSGTQLNVRTQRPLSGLGMPRVLEVSIVAYSVQHNFKLLKQMCCVSTSQLQQQTQSINSHE
jgi:hypothetical protein